MPAPMSEVFRWWTEPDRMARWMSPVGNAEAGVDLRVGGTFWVTMVGEGHRLEHDGEYLEIDPPRRLVFTWRSPYTGPQPSVVTIDLEADGDSATLLRLVHSELPEAVVESHRGGWRIMFDRFERQLPAALISEEA